MQFGADRAASAHVAFHLGQRQAQLRTDVIARQVHMRHATVQQELTGRQILLQVERIVDMRRRRRKPAGPHDDDAIRDVRRQQQRTRDVGHAAQREHIQRLAWRRTARRI